MTSIKAVLPFITALALCAQSQAAIIVDDVDGTYDGTQSTVASTVTLNLDADFGFTFWFKTTTKADQSFLGFGNTSGLFNLRMDDVTGAGVWMPRIDAGPDGADGRVQPGDFTGTTVDLSDGSWHQVAYTFEFIDSANGTTSLYVNGSLLGSVTEDLDFGVASGGATIFGGGNTPFAGELSDIAWYDSTDELTPTLINDLYNAGAGTVVIPEPSAGLLLMLAMGGLLQFRRRRS